MPAATQLTCVSTADVICSGCSSSKVMQRLGSASKNRWAILWVLAVVTFVRGHWDRCHQGKEWGNQGVTVRHRHAVTQPC